MDHLLFISGIYDTIDLFITALSEAFTQLGYKCHIIDVRDEISPENQLKTLLEDITLKAVITFNNIGYNMSLSEGKNIWEERDILYCNILMDHPFHYDYPLRHAPETSFIYCTDKNHVDYIKRFYPKIKNVDFMAHAGMEADISIKTEPGTCYLHYGEGVEHPPIEERPIDVLYAGGLSKYVAEGVVPDLGEITEFDAFTLTGEVLSDLMQHPSKTTEAAIEEYLIKIGKHYTDEELRHWITELRFIDFYATSFYREQAVQLLVENGIKVAVFGGGWDQCDWADNPNLLYGGKVLAPQVLELMNHSKIVLNTMTWYKNGIHDRIINGMLAKAVVVTDTSVYLGEAVESSDNGITAEKLQEMVETFELPAIELLPDKIKALLSNQVKMQAIADTGYIYAKAHHTWMQRAKQIESKFMNDF